MRCSPHSSSAFFFAKGEERREDAHVEILTRVQKDKGLAEDGAKVGARAGLGGRRGRGGGDVGGEFEDGNWDGTGRGLEALRE
jgi:hypothetical protein